MLALGAATGVIATIRTRTILETEFSKRGLAIAADLAMFSVRPLLANDLATLRKFVNHSMTQDYVRSISVLDPDGTVVMDSDIDQLRKAPPRPAEPRGRLRRTPGYRERARRRGRAVVRDRFRRSRRRARGSAPCCWAIHSWPSKPR